MSWERFAAAAAEPLLPELEPYVIEDGPLGPMLKHPLVFELALNMPGMVNERYRHKNAAAEKAAAEDDWSTYVFLHERPYRFNALEFADVFGTCPPQEFWQLVADVWTDSENVWQNAEAWRDLLERAGADERRWMMDEEEADALAVMPDEITVWRGCIAGQNEDGFSWTIDREKAEWFAKRFASAQRGEGRVIEGRVKRVDVIAHFTGRGESEIVVLPENVRHAAG